MTNLILNKKITINSFSSLFESIVVPVLMLVMVPVFLNRLGPNSFAIWILVNTFVTSLMALSFGGGNTVIKYISDTRYQSNATFSSIFTFQFFVIIILSIIFFFSAYVVEKMIASSLFEFTNYIIAIFFIKQLEALNYSFCKGKERYDISSMLSSIAKVVFLGTQLIILFFSDNLNFIFEYAIYSAVIVYVMQIIILKSWFKDFNLFHFYDLKFIKIVLQYSLWNWYLSIVGVIYSNFDKWLVGFVLGLEILGYYAVAVLFYNQSYMVVNSLVAWFFPMVSREGYSLKVKYLYNVLSKIIPIFTMFTCIFLLNYSHIFVLWLGEDNYNFSSAYISLFLCVLPLFVLKIIPHYMLLALGLVSEKFRYEIFILVVRVAIGVILINKYGIQGLIAGFYFDLVITVILYNSNFYSLLTTGTKLIMLSTIAFTLLSLLVVI